MGASNETDKTREQTAKEPENASHLPDKLVAQRREVAEKVARDMEELGIGWKQPWVQAGAPELPPLEPNSDADFGLLADELKASCRCPVEEAVSPDAFYSPIKDKVTVPKREQFESNAAFCGTLLHEMAHATAPELGRDVVNTFGTEAYAREARTAYEADRAEKERLGDKKTAIEKQKAGSRSERAARLKRSAERKRQQQASSGPSRRGPSSRDADQSRGRSR